MNTLQSNPEYLQKHPNAVKDEQSAHLMALVGNEKRTQAAQSREVSRIFGDASLIGVTHVGEYYNYKQREMFDGVSRRLRVDELDTDEAFIIVNRIFSNSSLTKNKPYELQAGHIAIANLHFYNSSWADLKVGASRWFAHSVDLDSAADELEQQTLA